MDRFDEIVAGEGLPERSHCPDNAYLFLYNAAIWNAHRIHYDLKYATEEEGYPGIVIDGPLQADWLSQVVLEWAGDTATMIAFKVSHRKATYLGETLTAGGKIFSVDPDAREATLHLFIRNEQGEVVTPGEAVVRFAAG